MRSIRRMIEIEVKVVLLQVNSVSRCGLIQFSVAKFVSLVWYG